MSDTLKLLDESVAHAAKLGELPATQGAAKGGTWQWCWYPAESEEDSRQLLLLAEGDEEGWSLSLMGFGVPSGGPTRRVYYLQRLQHGDIDPARLSDTLAVELKKAWRNLQEGSGLAEEGS